MGDPIDAWLTAQTQRCQQVAVCYHPLSTKARFVRDYQQALRLLRAHRIALKRLIQRAKEYQHAAIPPEEEGEAVTIHLFQQAIQLAEDVVADTHTEEVTHE